MQETRFETYKEAFRRININDAKKGFKGHLIAYVVMNSILVVVNLATNPGKLWCLGSIVGWGIGVVAHYVGGVKILEKKLMKMESEAEKLAGQPQ